MASVIRIFKNVMSKFNRFRLGLPSTTSFYNIYKKLIRNTFGVDQSVHADIVIEMLHAELKCSICLNLIMQATAVIHCGHLFCHHCIKRWRSSSNTCPICRTEVLKLLKVPELDHFISAILTKLQRRDILNEREIERAYRQAYNLSENLRIGQRRISRRRGGPVHTVPVQQYEREMERSENDRNDYDE